MNKFVKIGYNHVVNTAAVKAVHYYELFSTMVADLDGAPADAVMWSRDLVKRPLLDGRMENAYENQAFETKVGKGRTLKVKCDPDRDPIGCLRLELMDGEVYLVPAYDEHNGDAQKLLAAFNLDY